MSAVATCRRLALVGALLAGPAAAGTITADFSGKWVYPKQALEFELGEDFDPHAGEIRIFAGKTDVSALAQAVGPRRLRVDARAPWPAGSMDLAVYQVGADNQWTEYARVPVQVLTGAGFEVAEFDPVVQLNNKGQLTEGHSGSAAAPDPRTYQDLAGQAGWSSRHVSAGKEVRSRAAFFGSSRRQEALRFGQQGADAPKLDLSDYLVEVERGGSLFALGHVQFGTHPLLISNIGNRGILFRQKVGSRFDVALASQNGTSVVGYDRLLGAHSFDHSISGISTGLEVFADQPGALRFELGYMTARIESASDFDVGEVPDAETSRGVGGRVLGNLLGGRIRADLAFARSRYDNPPDPLLEQGDAVVPVREQTNTAWSGRLDFGILQGAQWLENWPISLSLGLQQSRADPLYRSLAAYVTPDALVRQLDLGGQIGIVSLSLSRSLSEDNLDEIATILKTKTGQTTATLGLPLGSLFTSLQPWLPALSANYQGVHQRAVSSPNTADSGFNATSHLPDQVTQMYGATASWSAGQWDFGYAYTLSDQDNRQLGRQLADFENRGHAVNAGLRVVDWLGVTVNLSRTRVFDHERNLTLYTDGGGLGLTSQLRKFSFAGSYNQGRNHDSLVTSENRSMSANAQVAWAFELPVAAYVVPGRVFLSYQRSRNEFLESLFGVAGNSGNWSLTSGLSLTLF